MIMKPDFISDKWKPQDNVISFKFWEKSFNLEYLLSSKKKKN